MKMTMLDVKQLVVIVAIAVIGVIAAIAGNWAFTGTIVTGAFALLHFRQGGENEKADSIATSV